MCECNYGYQVSGGRQENKSERAAEAELNTGGLTSSYSARRRRQRPSDSATSPGCRHLTRKPTHDNGLRRSCANDLCALRRAKCSAHASSSIAVLVPSLHCYQNLGLCPPLTFIIILSGLREGTRRRQGGKAS